MESYGYISDAFFHAVETVEMLLDPDWGNLTEAQVGNLTFVVNYNSNYPAENDNGK